LAGDRRFLVHTPDGVFISGRSHPRLVLIETEWNGTTLRLSTSGRPELVLAPVENLQASVAVWKDRFFAWDQGDGPARWLSEFLGDEVRLAWLGDSRRPLRWDRDRRLTFADAAPLMALGSASLADLARRVGQPLSMRRFRPNLVIDGADPYEEDSWRRVRIGAVEFLHLDGCSRCEFTTIDPETAERHPRGEPVATLETFRRVDTGIYFGMNLMPLIGGTLRIGDEVTVLETRRPLFFGSARPLEAALESLKTETKKAPWPEGPSVLRCLGVRDEAPGVKTFLLVRGDGVDFSWNAGQYLTLKVDLPEGPLRRSYTISSAPGTGLQITVKRLEGRVSTWLHDHLRPSVAVVGEAVGGAFTLNDHPWDSYLFLGAGSGVTPLIAMLREIAAHDLPVDVAFHQSARTRADLLFTAELERLRHRLDGRLTVSARVTAEEGHIDHQALVKFCPDLRDRRAFVCGPDGYRAAVRGLLSGAGFKVDRRYHEELFGEAALEVPDTAFPGMVTFARSGKTTASDGKTTLLQLAERAGIDLPSSCRSGDCGICRVKLSAGEWVLACHTFPQGDTSLDL
jgi:uncharacterized protein YcbX/ferredoxin-NADP reductase